MCIFHKWRNIQKEGFASCMGESYTKKYSTEYDICIKCSSIKEYMYDSGGGARYCIDDEAENIIRKNLKNGELSIEGGFNYKQIKEEK